MMFWYTARALTWKPIGVVLPNPAGSLHRSNTIDWNLSGQYAPALGSPLLTSSWVWSDMVGINPSRNSKEKSHLILSQRMCTVYEMSFTQDTMRSLVICELDWCTDNLYIGLGRAGNACKAQRRVSFRFHFWSYEIGQPFQKANHESSHVPFRGYSRGAELSRKYDTWSRMNQSLLFFIFFIRRSTESDK